MLLSGFGQAVHPGHHGLSLSDAFADVQGADAPLSDPERLMTLMANPHTPHQPPRADPPADASTYYSGCVRASTSPEPLATRATFLSERPTLARENRTFARQVRRQIAFRANRERAVRKPKL